MKITIITSIHPDYDARIWKHCHSCKRLGYNVTLLCQWEGVPSGINTIDGVKVINYGSMGSRPFRLLKNNYKVFKAILLHNKSDIYHFHDIDILPVMTVLSFFKKVVYDIHENYPEEMLEKFWLPRVLRRPLFYLVWFVQYFSIKVIKNIVLVAESQDEKIPKTNINKEYIYNYASKNVHNYNFLDKPKYSYDFIFTASQYKENGIELLIDALTIIKKLERRVTVLAVDRFKSEKYRSFIFKKIDDLGLHDYIIFFPNVLPHKLPEMLIKCRIGLVLDIPSKRRLMAIPTKIFEYYSAGLKVIASDLPNNRRFVNNEKLGFIFNANNPNLLAEKMLETTIQSIDQLAIREIFENDYSWESQDSLYKKLYKNAK